MSIYFLFLLKKTVSRVANFLQCRAQLAERRQYGAQEEIAGDLAVDDDFAGGDFGMQMGGASDHQPAAFDRDRAFDFAVNLQVFLAGDIALDFDAWTQTSKIACDGVSRARDRVGIERCGWISWRLCRGRARHFGLRLLGQHRASFIRSEAGIRLGGAEHRRPDHHEVPVP